MRYKKDSWTSVYIWLLACLFYLYEYFVRVTPSIMMEDLQQRFATSALAITSAITCYNFIYSPMQLIIGGLYDHYRARNLLLMSCFCVAMGCLIAPFPSNSLMPLCMGRLLQGFGSSFAFVGTMYLVAIWFSPKYIALLSGLTTSLGLLGGILGEPLLATASDRFNWQGIWILAGVLGFIFFFSLFLLPKATPADYDHPKKGALKSFSRSFKSVVKSPQTWIIGLVAGPLFLILMAFADLWGIQFVRLATGVNKLQAAKVVSWLYWGWFLGGPLMGFLSDRQGSRKPLLILGTIGTLLLFSIVLYVPNLSPLKISFFLFLSGVFASTQVSCFALSIENNALYAKGMAIAVVNLIVNGFGAICLPLIGKFLDLQNNALSTPRFTHYQKALSLIPICLSLAILASFFLRNKRRETNTRLEGVEPPTF